MPLFEIDEKQMYYEDAGSGKPLLLVHSALMNSAVWDEQFSAFAQDCRVIRCDLYGYGKSTFTGQKIVNHGADLAALLDHLQIDKACILGLSMGGEIALNFALEYSARVNGLILVCAGLEGYDYPEASMAWWGGFIGAIQARDFSQARKIFIESALEGVHNPLPSQVRARIEDIISTYNFQHYWDTNLTWRSLDEPAAAQLHKLTCPTLVMVGADDKPVILDIADVLAKSIPGAEKVLVPDSAHIVNLQQPDAFNHAVTTFLATRA
jgi:pimeloyl-ACP methyl ester carboxylesterase